MRSFPRRFTGWICLLCVAMIQGGAPSTVSAQRGLPQKAPSGSPQPLNASTRRGGPARYPEAVDLSIRPDVSRNLASGLSGFSRPLETIRPDVMAPGPVAPRPLLGQSPIGAPAVVRVDIPGVEIVGNDPLELRASGRRMSRLTGSMLGGFGKTRFAFANEPSDFPTLPSADVPRHAPGAAREELHLARGTGRDNAPGVSKKSAFWKADSSGNKHPLTFDPAVPREPLWRVAFNTLRRLPTKLRRIRAYFRRVDELVGKITDEELLWSISRLGELKSQEGILRSNNNHLVNKWTHGAEQVKKLSFADFRESSLDVPSLIRAFKGGMDNEAPTLMYQFTSAHNLHNYLPRVSHFMGWTLQEYILAVALKGRQGQQAIWAMEEVRHGPILEAVYNKVRPPGRPALEQQGIASKEPAPGAYSARSMMANRALAEFAAAAAYLLIKANSIQDSPTDRVLDGIYRDEVYHKVIMEAVNMHVYGQRSRWHRIAMILRHNQDYPKPKANDLVVFDRKFASPLLIFEIAYAFNALDKRIDRFLKTLSETLVRDMIGEVYPTDKEAQAADRAITRGSAASRGRWEAALERGEHTWTPYFRSMQNPELTLEEARELEKRFPGYYRLEDRSILESVVLEIISTYRRRSLTSPRYWMRKKGFYRDGAAGRGRTSLPAAPDAYFPSGAAREELHLARGAGRDNAPGAVDASGLWLSRPLEGSPGALLRLRFSETSASPDVYVFDESGREVFSSPLERLSMLQIGTVMDAESLDVLQELRNRTQDLSVDEIVRRLNNSAGYQKNPIQVIHDVSGAH